MFILQAFHDGLGFYFLFLFCLIGCFFFGRGWGKVQGEVNYLMRERFTNGMICMCAQIFIGLALAQSWV